MPLLNGLQVLKRTKEIDSKIQIIMLTAFDDVDSTIKAMQYGAYDYVEKMELERIKAIVKRALESKKLSERLVIAISEDSSEFQLENSLIGSTKAMKEIFKKIGKISSTRVNVLIQGDSGTGKELITKIIHYCSLTRICFYESLE